MRRIRIAVAAALLLPTAAPSQPPRALTLTGNYSGRMNCPRGETLVRLAVYSDGRGKVSVYPPSYGVDFDVELIQKPDRTIRITPTGSLDTTSYIARRYRVPLFGAEMRSGTQGLYGHTTEPGCGPLALLEHSSSVPLTPEQFNRLADELAKEMLRRGF